MFFLFSFSPFTTLAFRFPKSIFHLFLVFSLFLYWYKSVCVYSREYPREGRKFLFLLSSATGNTRRKIYTHRIVVMVTGMRICLGYFLRMQFLFVSIGEIIKLWNRWVLIVKMGNLSAKWKEYRKKNELSNWWILTK